MSRRSGAAPLAGLLTVVLAASCAAGSPHRRPGPGGISYQWPPPAAQTRGAPSAGRFCALLVDDYQHLKTLESSPSTAQKSRIAGDYVAFAPTLEAAAPSGIASAATTYVGSVSALVSALVRADFDVLKVPQSTLTSLTGPSVSAAAASLIGYSRTRCHYDMQADSAPNG